MQSDDHGKGPATYAGVPSSQATPQGIAEGAQQEHPAYRAVREAINEVARLGAHPVVTDATTKLIEARELVRQFLTPPPQG